MDIHRVAVLALDGVVPFDLGIPTGIFGTRPNTPYRLTVCGRTRAALTTSAGFTLRPQAGLAALADANTIIVPGYFPHRIPPPQSVLVALRAAAKRGARMTSICTGAFALAAAGLLDGRTVTTHWGMAAELEELFPNVRVDPDVLYIDDNLVLTSAGVTAGVDLCLHIVRKDLGAHIANDIARHLVASPHRAGGQAQYIPTPLPDRAITSLRATRAWALTRLGSQLALTDLADHARFSTRTLTRLWRAETGVSPHQWLLSSRISHARELLEKTDLSIEQISTRCGLGSATNFRARFRDALRTTPTSYRHAFRHGAGDVGIGR